MNRWFSWAAMAVVLLGALVVGVTDAKAPRTESERVAAIASTIQCPTCSGLSSAESDASAAQAVREEIRGRLRQGESEAEIRSYFVSRYGEGILLEPRTSGAAALVWLLPIAGGTLAVAALVATFRRWKRERDAAADPSADDRALVEAALR